MSEPNVNVIVGGPNNSSTKNKIRILKANLPFTSQVNEEDVIYVIRYDFDLNGATVTIPENCVLQVEGGKLYNGILHIGQNKVNIIPNYNSIFGEELIIPDNNIPVSGVICFKNNKVLHSNGEKWLTSDGYTDAINKGTTDQRPTSVLTEEDAGYEYFDITLGKPIYLKVENTSTTEEPVYVKFWVDALGNPVDSVYPKVINTTTDGHVAVFNGTDIEDGGPLPETTPEIEEETTP